MEESKVREFKCVDEDGNIMRLVLEPQEKYPTRFDLKYFFNTKLFKLQHFPSWRDASNMWDLLELISLKKGEK
jgi:hypothetical protein